MLLLIALENIFQYANLQKIYKNEYFEDKFEYGGAVARWRSPLFFITEKNGKNKPSATLTLTLTLTDSLALYFTLLCFTLLCSLALASLLHYRNKRKKQKKTETFACGRLIANAYLSLYFISLQLLAGARHLFHYRNKRKKQKKTEICSLALAYFFITEKNGKNKPSATLTITLTLTKFDDNDNANQYQR